MNQQEKFRQAFSHLHASGDTLQEVIQLANKQAKPKHTTRRVLILAAVFTLLISMTLVAYGTGFLSEILATLRPAGNSGPVLEDMYGDQIPSNPPYMEDYLGNPIALPDMERIPLDAQAAQDMVGAYVSAVDGSFTVGNSTFSLCTFMIDEMGMGAFTWTVENPNGIYYKDIGYGMVDFNANSPFLAPTLMQRSTGSDQKDSLCDSFNYLIKAENNGTRLHLVTYFATTEALDREDILVWQAKDMALKIQPASFMPAHKLTEETGMTVCASYQGLVLNAHSETEIVPGKLTILLEDGTQYTVMDSGKYNQSGAVWRKNGNATYDQLVMLFNRLIDPEKVDSIVLEYTWRETVEHNGELESILHKENKTFYP